MSYVLLYGRSLTEEQVKTLGIRKTKTLSTLIFELDASGQLRAWNLSETS